MTGAAPPAWWERNYASEVTWPGGRLPIRVELTQVSRAAPIRREYVRAVKVQRLDQRP
jgi:hypothetical protein